MCASSKKKVLIIDDEPHVVTYLEMLLQDEGYETLSASNGRIGMQQASAHQPDLICLDITMPEESGIRFYHDIRRNPQLSATPVVVVTAVTGPGGDQSELNRLLDDNSRLPDPEAFFSKPIDRAEFVDAIGKLLG